MVRCYVMYIRLWSQNKSWRSDFASWKTTAMVQTKKRMADIGGSPAWEKLVFMGPEIFLDPRTHSTFLYYVCVYGYWKFTSAIVHKNEGGKPYYSLYSPHKHAYREAIKAKYFQEREGDREQLSHRSKKTSGTISYIAWFTYITWQTIFRIARKYEHHLLFPSRALLKA